jgi:hypothetical protein
MVDVCSCYAFPYVFFSWSGMHHRYIVDPVTQYTVWKGYIIAKQWEMI